MTWPPPKPKPTAWERLEIWAEDWVDEPDSMAKSMARYTVIFAVMIAGLLLSLALVITGLIAVVNWFPASLVPTGILLYAGWCWIVNPDGHGRG